MTKDIFLPNGFLFHTIETKVLVTIFDNNAQKVEHTFLVGVN